MRFFGLKSLRFSRRLVFAGSKPWSAFLSLAVSASLVASPPQPPQGKATAASTEKTPRRWYQIGKATWYGRGFQGKRTATGERFDMNGMTCAHRTLPLGSWLRVTNLYNRKSTFVRVNDRGGFGSDTIIDLSYAAAKRVGLLGRAKVKVEQVRSDDPELAQALVAQIAVPEGAVLAR